MKVSVRLPIVLCLMGAVFLIVISGCGQKEQPVVDVEPTTPVETTPPPEPTPEPTPEVDIEALKAQIKDVFFDFDKYELKAEARAQLQTNAKLLKEQGWSVVLEGHCDERGTEEYNLALGERRANAVRGYLADLGVSNSELSTISYGEEKPFEMGSNEAAWAKNRRVHFRFN